MQIKRILADVALASASLMVGLVVAELSLRAFFPQYQYAAEAVYDPDQIRIFSNHPNTYESRSHPDTLASHKVIHNNLGLRQHRRITEDNLDSEVIAVFGDSFVENLRLPVQYGFVDTLDYLVNAAGHPAMVLNFGTDGYGIDQEYLQYLGSPPARRARHVLYVFSANDLRNLWENNLFRLDEAGTPIRTPVPQPSAIMRLLSRLYLTYFALETRQKLLGIGRRAYSASDFANRELKRAWWERFNTAPGEAIETSFVAGDFDPIARYLRLFQVLLAAWQAAVERDGGQFHVVLLPSPNEQPLRRLLSRDVSLIDLYAAFGQMLPNYSYDQIRFRSDAHWNETGNMYAAIALARVIAEADGWPPPDDAEVARRLGRYYAAFPADWRPAEVLGLPLPPDGDPEGEEAIRLKYLELEQQAGAIG